MKCEHCGKNAVSFVFHSNCNGQVEEHQLCQNCAQELGYAQRLQESYAGMEQLFATGLDSFFSPRPLFSGFGPSSFVPSLLGAAPWEDRFLDSFFSSVPPSVPSKAPVAETPLLSPQEEARLSQERERNALRAQLKAAIEAEEFERAAQLRDALRGKSA